MHRRPQLVGQHGALQRVEGVKGLVGIFYQVGPAHPFQPKQVGCRSSFLGTHPKAVAQVPPLFGRDGHGRAVLGAFATHNLHPAEHARQVARFLQDLKVFLTHRVAQCLFKLANRILNDRNERHAQRVVDLGGKNTIIIHIGLQVPQVTVIDFVLHFHLGTAQIVGDRLAKGTRNNVINNEEIDLKQETNK